MQQQQQQQAVFAHERAEAETENVQRVRILAKRGRRRVRRARKRGNASEETLGSAGNVTSRGKERLFFTSSYHAALTDIELVLCYLEVLIHE